MSGEITVRQGTAADMPAVVTLERDCEEAPHWNDTIWSELLHPSSSSGVQRVCFVVENQSRVVGFLVLSRVGDVAEIESIAVLKEARRSGTGRALCNQARHWAQSEGAETMELEVRGANEGALAMYRSMGFTEQGRRRGYYTAPSDDAVLMALSLSEEGAKV